MKEKKPIDLNLKMAFLMCVLGTVFYFYEYYLRVAPSVMQGELTHAFNISAAGLGSLAAYYYLSYVPLQLPVGIMMDRWGPRRILTFACVCCAIGTYLFAGTSILWIAKFGRFLLGFGSAFAYVGVLKIASLWLPNRYFAMTAGICTTLGMLGAISGEILMAKFVAAIGWKETLYSSGFVGFILAVVLWCFIRDKSDQEFREKGRAQHVGRSLKDELLEVIKNGQLWINGMIGCLTFLPLTIFAEMWAVSFLEVTGLGKHTAAAGSAAVFFGFGIGGPIWGKISEIMASRKIPLIMGSAVSACFAVALIYFTPDNTYLLFSLLFFCGLFASAQVLVFAIGNDICRPELSATTAAFTNFLVMLGGIAIQPLVGILLDFVRSGAAEPSYYSLADYRMALFLMPLGLFLGFLLSLVLKESYTNSEIK